jgi:hypothetical protein
MITGEIEVDVANLWYYTFLLCCRSETMEIYSIMLKLDDN